MTLKTFFVTFILICMSTAEPVTLTGAGATFPYAVLKKWWNMFSMNVQPLNVLYDRTGSIEGIKRITQQTLDGPLVFAISDVPLNESDEANNMKSFPFLGGALVIGFNIPGVDRLIITREMLADIYLGTIKWWNDTKLQVTNPNVTLPEVEIIPIARRSSSGTTMVFTTCLNSFSKTWALNQGIFNSPEFITPVGPSKNWPTVKLFGFINSDIAGMIASIPYSLGYLSFADVTKRNLTIATMENKAGNLLHPSKISDGVEKVMESVGEQEKAFDGLVDSDQEMAYPLATFSYFILNITTTPGITCNQMKALIRFIHWALREKSAIDIVRKDSLVPLNERMVQAIDKKVLQDVTCEGKNVWKMILEEKIREDERKQWANFPFVVAVGVICFILILMFAYFRHIARKNVKKDWLINDSEVTEENEISEVIWMHPLSNMSTQSSGSKILSNIAAGIFNDGGLSPILSGTMARWNSKHVLLFRSGTMNNPNTFKFKTSKRLSQMVRKVSHQNVLPLLGMMVKNKSNSFAAIGIYHVYENPQKSSLHSMLITCPYNLNRPIFYSLAIEVCKGMKYLHDQGIVHGVLDTWNCLLDPNWTVKVGNWAQNVIASDQYEANSESVENIESNVVEETEEEMMFKRLVFQHPEILAGKLNIGKLTEKHDLYSFALVLIEIFTRDLPFCDGAKVAGWKKVLQEITKESGVLPTARTDVPRQMKNLVKQLSNSTIHSFSHVLEILMDQEKDLTDNKSSSIIENLLKVIDEHTKKLEELVQTSASTDEPKVTSKKRRNDFANNKNKTIDGSRVYVM